MTRARDDAAAGFERPQGEMIPISSERLAHQVLGMSDAGIAAWLRLVRWLWDHGPVPADEGVIAHCAGLGVVKWRKLRAAEFGGILVPLDLTTLARAGCSSLGKMRGRDEAERLVARVASIAWDARWRYLREIRGSTSKTAWYRLRDALLPKDVRDELESQAGENSTEHRPTVLADWLWSEEKKSPTGGAIAGTIPWLEAARIDRIARYIRQSEGGSKGGRRGKGGGRPKKTSSRARARAASSEEAIPQRHQRENRVADSAPSPSSLLPSQMSEADTLTGDSKIEPSLTSSDARGRGQETEEVVISTTGSGIDRVDAIGQTTDESAPVDRDDDHTSPERAVKVFDSVSKDGEKSGDEKTSGRVSRYPPVDHSEIWEGGEDREEERAMAWLQGPQWRFGAEKTARILKMWADAGLSAQDAIERWKSYRRRKDAKLVSYWLQRVAHPHDIGKAENYPEHARENLPDVVRERLYPEEKASRKDYDHEEVVKSTGDESEEESGDDVHPVHGEDAQNVQAGSAESQGEGGETVFPHPIHPAENPDASDVAPPSGSAGRALAGPILSAPSDSPDSTSAAPLAVAGQPSPSSDAPDDGDAEPEAPTLAEEMAADILRARREAGE